jgi:excinuclease ABC subunit C
VSSDFVDQDVIGYHRQGIALEIALMSIRDGKLTGSRTFSFTGQEFPDAELVSSFIGLYYDMGAAPPDEVLLPIEIEDAALKAEWLGERRAALPGGGSGTLSGSRGRRKVELLVPQRGDRKKLVDLATKNAAASFASRRNARADVELALGKLQKRLKLARLPRVIECYDVSHLQGFATVASMVVFVDGRPEKTRYRTYKVRAPGAGGDPRKNDDFASMYEVLSRRFRRAREADGKNADSTWKLPDLIVVDGGKGQLAMALAAARDVGIDVRPGVGLPIVALAKERDVALDEGLASEATPSEEAPAPPPPAAKPGRGGNGTTKPDRVFLPHAKDAIPIRPSSAEMFVLQQLRDEAHRFAITFHRSQRRRLTLRSALSDIPGIGPGRQRHLLRHFGSIRRVREATVDQLAAVPGINRTVAEAVHAHWARQPLEATVIEPQPTPEQAAAEEPQAEERAIEAAFGDDGDPLARRY